MSVFDGEKKRVKIEKLEISGKDVRPQLSELEIYEDIFSVCMTGTLTLADSIDIRTLLPLTGFEKLKVKYKLEDGGGSYSYDDFYVYNVQEIQIDAALHKRQTYVVKFCSKEILKTVQNIISKSYKGKKIDEIVEDICKEAEIKDKEIEKTKEKHDIIIPSWKPFQAINWLAARAEAEGNGTSMFLFFQNTENKYYFVSLKKLFSKGPKVIMRYGVQNAIDAQFKDLVLKIIQYDYIDYMDSIRGQINGMWASNLRTIDFVRLESKTKDFDYKEDFEKSEHVEGKMGKDFIMDDSDDNKDPNKKKDSVRKFYPTNKEHNQKNFIISKKPITERQPGINPNSVEKWLLPRISKMEQTKYLRMRLVVPGDTKIKAGAVVSLELPDTTFENEDVKYFSGKHLVTAIHHKINSDGYVMIVETMKDCVIDKFKRQKNAGFGGTAP